MLTLNIEVEPGTSITNAVIQCCQLVNLIKCRVKFTFNGINCLVKSDFLDIYTIQEKYDKHIDKESKYTLIF